MSVRTHDGSPTIGVGPTDPGPPPEAEVAGAPKKIVDPAPAAPIPTAPISSEDDAFLADVEGAAVAGVEAFVGVFLAEFEEQGREVA